MLKKSGALKHIPKFYALTQQKEDFEKPKMADILALAEVKEKSKNLLDISFLQVNPECNYYSRNSKRAFISSECFK